MIAEKPVKVAVAQISPEYMDKEGTVDRVCKTIESASRKGAEFLHFRKRSFSATPTGGEL